MRNAAIWVAISLTTATTSAAAEPIMTHQGMEAYQLSCEAGKEAGIEVRVSSPDMLDGDRVEFQRLVGQVRAVLSFNCPKVSRITIRGTYRNQLYFAGASQQDWRWRVLGLYAPPEK